MNDETRLLQAGTFDDIAELYDQARRACPDQFFSDLFAQAGNDPVNASVLEIGCGTGQATLPLARRGCRMVCIEMGVNLAGIARRNLLPFAQVEIANARFEDWEANSVFDIVLSVNSWHWLDPRLRYAKAATLLRAAGVLAFTTGHHAFPPGFDPFFTEMHACYEAVGETSLEWPPPPPHKIPDAREEIERSGYFDRVKVTRHLWAEEFTADEYVRLMSTASDHRLMEPAKREHLFAEMHRLIAARPGGSIRKHNLTILHVARPTAGLAGIRRHLYCLSKRLRRNLREIPAIEQDALSPRTVDAIGTGSSAATYSMFFTSLHALRQDRGVSAGEHVGIFVLEGEAQDVFAKRRARSGP